MAECKHEGQDGKKFCSDCGEQLQDEREEKFLDKLADRVIQKLQAAPEAGGEKGTTLLDKFLNKPGKGKAPEKK